MSNPFFPNYEKPLITSRFGMRFHPVDKRDKMHNGIDMTATNDGHSGHVDHICAHTGGTVDAARFDEFVIAKETDVPDSAYIQHYNSLLTIGTRFELWGKK